MNKPQNQIPSVYELNIIVQSNNDTATGHVYVVWILVHVGEKGRGLFYSVLSLEYNTHTPMNINQMSDPASYHRVVSRVRGCNILGVNCTQAFKSASRFHIPSVTDLHDLLEIN